MEDTQDTSVRWTSRQPDDVSLSEVSPQHNTNSPAQIEVTIVDNGSPRLERNSPCPSSGSEATPVPPSRSKHEKAFPPSYNELYGQNEARPLRPFPRLPSESRLPLQQEWDPSVDPHIISAGEIRDVLLRHVGERWCYGNHAAQEMNINRTVPSYAFHYKLSSFVEQRELLKIFQPYEGETIDRSRAPPGIWEIPVIPSQMFNEEEKKVVVPNSNEVKTCHKCRGTGKMEGFSCAKCHGSKRTMCKACHGCGMLDGSRPCARCLGKGTKKCLTCGGVDTSVVCQICKGKQKVLSHTVVHVKFRQIISDYVIDSAKSEIPKAKLYKAKGTKHIDETSQRVAPITNNPDSRINLKSQHLITTHQQMAEQQRMFIHQQTHCLQILPITEIHWNWETKADRFWVYGDDHRVYFPSYPQKNCFGVCSIL